MKSKFVKKLSDFNDLKKIGGKKFAKQEITDKMRG